MNTALCVLGVFVCLSYMSSRPAHAQYMPNPKKYFKPLKFDMELRGSYNITKCVSDNMNCWEVVKPDLICGWHSHYPTICDTFVEQCYEYKGDQDDYWYSMNVQEMWCSGWQYNTK